MTSETHSWSHSGTADDDMFDVDEAELHRQTLQSMRQHGSPLVTTTAATTTSTETAAETDHDSENAPGDATADTGAQATDAVPADGAGHPYIKITPAREQVTPKQVVKGLFGFYRAGQGRSFPFDLARHLPLITPRSTFEFLIHKPAGARRFDFYMGVHPYSPTAFTNLASNISAMYPGAFTFEVVAFSPAAAFDPDQDEYGGSAALAEREGIEDLESVTQVELGADRSTRDEAGSGGSGTNDDRSDATAEAIADGLPAMARWIGVETQSDDYMTLLDRFTEVATDTDDGYRSPLSVLLEQAVGTAAPFLYQVVWTPRPDWTKQAEKRKRNLKLGYKGTLDAFTTEFVRVLAGAGEAERRQRHRPSTPEQIGGTVSVGADADASQLSRMEQIDVKQPAVTFDLSIRAAGAESVIDSITGALNPLSGPYYGLKGKHLGHDDRAYRRLCDAEVAYSFRGRFGDTDPVIVASPDELATLVTVPHTAGLPQASRGASGGSPDARSPLTATDEDLLAEFDEGMQVGNAVTAPPSRENIPIHLTADQLVQHVLRTGTTGSGKTTAMINDALSAFEAFDGPVFLFDKKGGSLCEEYKRAHFAEHGDLENVIHLPVPGPNGEVPAFPLFDIRPQLAAGMPRETAVQEKVDRFNELLRYVVGEEAHDQAFVAREILNSLIEAQFDPVHGSDAFEIRDLLNAAHAMQKHQVIPPVSDDDLEMALKRHFNSDEYRFETSIDAVMNRLTKLRERDFVWRILNFVPRWDETHQQYTSDQMLFDLDTILDSTKVVLLDPGDLRPQSRNLFSVLVLDYIWSWVRLRQRWDAAVPTPADGYLVNLIIDEAAPIMQTALVRNEMIQDAREFALSFEIIVHFAEQVKKDDLDTKAYKELLRNFNTKLIGKLGIDQELARVLFHEELDVNELFDRTTSMPRGEVVAQLPDTGFMTDTPELVTLRPLPIPAGHSDSDAPVEDDTASPTSPTTFGTAAQHQWDHTRLSYCLIPGVNSPASAAQRAADENGDSNGEATQTGSGETSDDDAEGTEPGSSEEGPPSAEADESASSPSDHESDSVETDATGASEGAADDASTVATADTPTEEDASTDSDPSDTGGTRNEYGGYVGIVELSDSDDAAERDESGDAESASSGSSDGDHDGDLSDDLAVAGSPGTGGSADRTASQEDGDSPESPSETCSSTTGSTDREPETTSSSEGATTEMNNDSPDQTADASGGTEPAETSPADLTDDEQTFLRTAIQGLNGDLDEYDLTQSMTVIRNCSGSGIDIDKLTSEGYVEVQRIRGRKYYYVTPRGQAAVNREILHGRTLGDPFEKTRHKVYVAYLKRYIEDQGFVVKTYYEPGDGGSIYDIAAFHNASNGTHTLRTVGEVLTVARPTRVVKHYDDMSREGDIPKLWVVQSIEVAHELIRILADENRIDSVPYKKVKNYGRITEEAFGEDTTWQVIGAYNLIDVVNENILGGGR